MKIIDKKRPVYELYHQYFNTHSSGDVKFVSIDCGMTGSGLVIHYKIVVFLDTESQDQLKSRQLKKLRKQQRAVTIGNFGYEKDGCTPLIEIYSKYWDEFSSVIISVMKQYEKDYEEAGILKYPVTIAKTTWIG